MVHSGPVAYRSGVDETHGDLELMKGSGAQQRRREGVQAAPERHNPLVSAQMVESLGEIVVFDPDLATHLAGPLD
jgi:hypothetical protein